MFSAERPFAFRNHQDARKKVTAKVKTNTVPSGFVFAGSLALMNAAQTKLTPQTVAVMTDFRV